MVCSIPSLGLHGVSGYPVTAECDLSGGLPAFTIVGLPDAAVTEARERVRSAIKNCGFAFPVSRITVNLAPAHLKKVGTLYDLPILVGILAAGGQIRLTEPGCAFLGELSLSGQLRPCAGMLPMALAAKEAGIQSLFVPEENAAEATLAQGPAVYPLRDVAQLARHLTGEEPISPAPPWQPGEAVHTGPDFAEVKGQEQVKRALEIAAAGGHNVLMSGPPGSGKSMLARRLPGILPDMTLAESLETTQIHSVMGLTSSRCPLVETRPFRSPHHTISPMGMAGGGSNPRPGEISYPSRFMLVCAMNPCKCGWYGHPSGRCHCSDAEVKRYLSRLSGPLLDRIDLFVQVDALDFEELSTRQNGESSEQIRQRVNRVRTLQGTRSEATCNARMGPSELDRFCALDEDCLNLMRGAFARMGLTARSYDRILRVARTIADLEESESIRPGHLAEALQFRPPEYLRR